MQVLFSGRGTRTCPTAVGAVARSDSPPDCHSTRALQVLAKNAQTSTKNNGEETSSPLFLAGALGLEPRTNGFGVAQKVRNPLKILAFCNAFQSTKTQNAML